MSIFNHFQNRYQQAQEEECSLQEYFELCKENPMTYSTGAEHSLAAIGVPELVIPRVIHA